MEKYKNIHILRGFAFVANYNNNNHTLIIRYGDRYCTLYDFAGFRYIIRYGKIY